MKRRFSDEQIIQMIKEQEVELMTFGTMSGQDMQGIIDRLVSFGYAGADKGEIRNSWN